MCCADGYIYIYLEEIDAGALRISLEWGGARVERKGEERRCEVLRRGVQSLCWSSSTCKVRKAGWNCL